MWESMIIHMMLGVLHMATKNPQKAAELKTLLLEVRDAIDQLYPSAT